MPNRSETSHLAETDCRHPQLHAPVRSACNHGHADHGHHTEGSLHLHLDVGHRPKQRRALWLSMLLSLGMMVIEFGAGWWSGSLMLTSDAIHMLSHVAALGISLLAIRFAARPGGERLPFGYYRVEVLAALLNGLGLALFTVGVLYEAFERLANPVPIAPTELLTVAVLGLIVNVLTAVILFRAGLEDLNTRAAWLHMLADGLSSIFVVIGGIVIMLRGWTVVDPLLSILVSVMVGKWALGLIREATTILLECKPDHIDPTRLKSGLRENFSQIHEIHDLHIWEITSNYVCLSVHICLDDMRISESGLLRTSIARYLNHDFGIGHTVIQFECASELVAKRVPEASPNLIQIEAMRPVD
jgi:cobalt-zinc-cadmium efflux system protein